MAKIEYDEIEREHFNGSPIGKAYMEYNDAVGGEMFIFNSAMPVRIYDAVFTEYGGLVGLYHECIKQGKTWQELLGTDGNWDCLRD